MNQSMGCHGTRYHLRLFRKKNGTKVALLLSGNIECEIHFEGRRVMDLIDREETLKAMDTWDKFGCDENCRLIPLRGIDENSYVPYVHYDDMVKAVKGMPSAQKTGKWIEKPHEVFLPRDCPPDFFDETYNYDNHSIIEYWWHCSECDYEVVV